MIIWLIIIINLIGGFVGYIIGSILPGTLVTKYKYHKNIYEFGSKSPGSSNVLRLFGKKIAIIILLLDAIKIIIAMGIASIFVYLSTINIFFFNNFKYLNIFLVGGFAVLGHCYPIWFHFRGGKASGSLVGFFVFWNPIFIPIFIFGIIIIYKLYQKVSIFSLILMIISAVLITLSIYLNKYFFIFEPLIWFNNSPIENLITTIIVWLLILLLYWRHKDNIYRLFLKKENIVKW